MYRQPQIDEKYKEEWLRAERQLALHWSEANNHPDVDGTVGHGTSSKEGISRNDFFKALKQVSHKTGKTKAALKSS